jgi:hypothetical protein
MKKISFLLLSAAVVAVLCRSAFPADNPQPIHAGTRILQSGNMVVEVGDPDSPDCRWNQGLRFSPVANVIRVQLNNRDFCYSPTSGGALNYVGGLPMEFDIGQEEFQPDPPGYNEGSNGSAFLKIGVGILRRNSSPYNFSASYPVIELAQITTTWQPDRVRFVQTLSGTANGYSCKLEEDLIVKNDRIIMNYVLTNTGIKTFTTEQYLHNFLTFSQRNVGPNYRVYFPYQMTVSPELQQWQPPELTIAVEQTDADQRVIIDSSLRSAYIGIWTTSYQVSPEQFVIITLAPGEKAEFTRTYTFSVDGSMPQDCTGDQIVNGSDLSAMSWTWLSSPDKNYWNPSCDLSADDIVNNIDLAVLGQVWGKDAANPEPIAKWSLDETAADNVGSNDGSLKGFSTDNSHWVVGHSGSSLNFDGTDDYIEVEGYKGICGKNPRTVSAWIKTQLNPTGNLPVIAWGQDEPGAYWLLEVDEQQRLRLSCGSGFISANEQQVGDGDWHHIAVVLDPVDPERPLVSDVKLYVDGRRRTIYKMEEAEINTGCTENVRIGAAHDPHNNYFSGIIDEVAIFNMAIGTSAIHQEYLH